MSLWVSVPYEDEYLNSWSDRIKVIIRLDFIIPLIYYLMKEVCVYCFLSCSLREKVNLQISEGYYEIAPIISFESLRFGEQSLYFGCQGVEEPDRG